MDPSTTHRSVAAEIAQIWAEHRNEAFVRLDVLERAIADLTSGTLPHERREAARAAAHKLRGSVGMFGFVRAGEIASHLEDAMARSGNGGPTAPELASMALALRSELESDPAAPLPAKPPASGVAMPVVCLVSADRALARSLEDASGARGVRVEPRDPSEWPSVPVRGSTVLVDLGPDPAVDPRLFGTIAAYIESEGTGAVVALAPSGALLDRVGATRMGARGFVRRDLAGSELLDAALRLASGAQVREPRVLLVDDDPAILAAASAMLENRGFTPETLDDPEQFWQRLEAVEPDVAVIDLDMPRVNGVDLCRAVRSDPRWARLPLVILTAFKGRDYVNAAFAAGADDFVGKPVEEDDLVSRLRNRLERVRAIEAVGDRDGLTGLPGRRQALRMVDSRPEAASVALIGIANLEQLNRADGYGAGDQMLCRVAESLAGISVAGSVARWSGNAFLAEPGAGEESLARVEAATPGLRIAVGIAEGSGREALARAEAALRESKRHGGGTRRAGATGGVSATDVIVVEDDAAVADVLATAIGSIGLSWARFADGSEAAEALTSPSLERPRVVLLDWDLPGLDGLSVLRRMRDEGVLDRTRVVMLTARASEEETLKALDLGAFDFVAKPFSVPILVERLRRALER